MDLFLLGLKTAIQPYYLFMAFLGAFLGVAFGAIPGINAILGVALLIPTTLTLDPIAAFILLGAVYTGGAVGGAFPAIFCLRSPALLKRLRPRLMAIRWPKKVRPSTM